MKTQLFLRSDGALVDLEMWLRRHGHRLVRLSYTRLHTRVIYVEGKQ